MNQTEFYDSNDIKWFPLNLHKKIPLYPPAYNCKVNQNDFLTLDDMEIIERQEYIEECNAIAVDTNNIYVIDIDFKDNVDYQKEDPEAFKFVQKLIDDNIAYKISTTKKQGKHFFFKPTKKLEKKRVQTIFNDIEILSGQWAFSPKDREIFGEEIKELDISKYIEEQPKPNKRSSLTYKNKRQNQSNKNIKEVKNMNENIKKYADLIDLKYIDNYDSWTKIIWSLANDDENHYEIAKYISMKSEKYNDESFDKLWNNSREGNSMGTMYYYAKLSNPDKYFEYKSEEVSEDFFTEDNLANIFFMENSDDLVYKDELVYVYYNNLWYEDRKLNKLKFFIGKKLTEYLSKIGIQIYKKMTSVDPENETLRKLYKSKNEAVNKTIGQIGTATKKKNIAECILHILSVRDFSEIEFDTNGYILPFKNNIYDLKSDTFRKADKEDYILTTVPYHLEDREQEKIDLLNNLFDQIFPDKNIKENYFAFLTTGLYGKHIEKFIIANGSGGNGKGVINELFEEMLSSNFVYKCSNAVLLQPLKEGINTQVANMNNKRLIVYSEPDSTVKKINGSTMKELTGGKGISAERKYSMNNKVVLKATHIMETNSKPKIDGRIDDSYIRRLVDIPFVSTFTNNKDLLAETDRANTFQADRKFKDDDFKEEYKHQLFWYLIDFKKNYKIKYGFDCIEKVEVCEEVERRTKEYLENSDEKFDWFKNNYQKKEGSYIQIKDVFDQFKYSEYYINLPKKDKRAENYSNLIKYISENVNFRAYFREVHRYYEHGVQKKRNNVLLGWEYKPIENENIEEDEAIEI